MRLIPCIFCNKQTEANNPKAIANICDSCIEVKKLTSILKNINFKKVEEATKRKLTLTLTTDGEII